MFSLGPITIRCLSHNDPFQLCILPSCTHPSVMCVDTHCDCYLPHHRCMRTASIHSLMTNMTIKGQAMKPRLVTIESYYNKIKKQIDI